MKVKKKQLKRIAKRMAAYAEIANIEKIAEPTDRISYHIMAGMERTLKMMNIKVEYEYDSEDNIINIDMPEYDIKQSVLNRRED